ncbi:MAG: hypothetical protein IOB84_13725 [Brevundimonas sp.]|nr:hypothetical protein [Brevundimonas sp.]
MTTFQQMRPQGPAWVRAEGDKFSGTLTFSNTETGARVQVPNIWYNQTAEDRADAMRFYAEQKRASAARIRAEGRAWSAAEADAAEARAAELDALAARMIETGEVLA